MPEERKIIPKPSNKYCPSCGAVYEEGEKFCSQCGSSLTKQKSNKLKTSQDPELIRKKRKKRIIITIVVVIVLLLLAGAAVAWSLYNQRNNDNKDFENKMNSIWSEVIVKSNSFNDNLQNPSTDKDLVRLNDQSKELGNLIKNKEAELDSIVPPKTKNYGESKDKLKTAFDKYSDYLSQLQDNILSKDIGKIKVSTDFSNVQKYADSAKDVVADFMNVSSYIKDSINNKVFDLTNLKGFVEDWQSEASNQNQQKNQQEEQAKQAANKQAAEKTVSDFINSLPSAYGNPDQWGQAQNIAGQYWASGSMDNFKSDYKFYFQGGAGVTYTGGQVISSEKISDTKYNISSEERERFTPPGGEASENRFLSYFIVENVNNRWVITSHGRR